MYKNHTKGGRVGMTYVFVPICVVWVTSMGVCVCDCSRTYPDKVER